MRTQEFKIKKDSIEKTPQGFLKVTGYATRTGVFKYYDSLTQRFYGELRAKEEVFKKDSLESMQNLPITDDHPQEMINSKNAKDFTKGMTLGMPQIKEDSYLELGILIMDEGLIRLVESGKKTELSCGYTCDTVQESGVFEGEKYDSKQMNIIYNHLAIVDMGRAGRKARIKFDSNRIDSYDLEVNKMAKIKIDNVEYEVNDNVASIISSKIDSLEKAEKTAKSEFDTLKGKFDALSVELENVRKIDLADIVNKRIDLLEKADKLLGKKADRSMTDRALMESVIKKDSKDLDLSKESNDYVRARFDALLEVNKNTWDTNVSSMRIDNYDDLEKRVTKARNDMLERSANAWLGGNKNGSN